jgi:hypothetical protein
MTNRYFVAINDPFSDTLTALGLQHILSELLEKQGDPPGGIQYVDCGAYIQLELVTPIRAETVAALNEDNYVMGGVRFIRTLKNTDSLPEDLPDGRINDYEALKTENAQFYEAIRQGKQGNDLPPKPLAWDVLRTINPAALPGWTNVLAGWWHLRPVQSTVIRLMLELYSQLPNPVDAAMDHWKRLNKEYGWGVSESATCQQFFNPDQGKGQNRTKADAVSVGNMKGFWLTEFLKMIGFYNDAITKTVAGGKDRKIFVIAPRNMNFGRYQAIMEQFKPTVTSEASIRFDILASLRYVRVLLAHFLEHQDALAAIMGVNIQHELVGGFNTAFYLDLGNAVATMNVSSIALPGWITVTDTDDIRDYETILDELIRFTRQFEEKNSDAFTLLQHLRDFISGDDLDAFFKLMNGFAIYCMGRRPRDFKYRLHIKTVENIIMKVRSDLSNIITNPGFLSIARAIRASTVTAQFLNEEFKNKHKRYPYEIRYGLSQTLLRKSNYPDEFVRVLTEFVTSYMAESARVLEMKMKSGEAKKENQYHFEGQRASIYEEDLTKVIQLIADNDPKTVANLLIAFGYVRTGSRKNQSNDNLQEKD